MGSGNRYTEEFKIEAVKQVTERGRPLGEVAERLGISPWSLQRWKKHYAMPPAERAEAADQSAEIARLKAELRRVTEEREIVKKAALHSTGHRNTGLQCSGRRAKAQRLARSPVELAGDAVELGLRVN